MTLKDLSKDQKQYLVLGALAAAILAILLVLGVKFSLTSISDAKAELAEFTSKIESADRTLTRRDQISSDFEKTMQILQELLEKAPPERNYYSWATEVVYSEAREVGLEIDSIDEIGGIQNKAVEKSDNAIRMESYALRITAHGGFESIKMFIDNIKQTYPLVRFTGVEISAGQTPDAHDVQLWLQWPFNLGSIVAKWESVRAKQRTMELKDNGNAPSVELTPVPAAEIMPESEGYPEAVSLPADTPKVLSEASGPAPKHEPTPPPPRTKTESEPAKVQNVVDANMPTTPRPEPEPAMPAFSVIAAPESDAEPENPVEPPVEASHLRSEPVVMQEPGESQSGKAQSLSPAVATADAADTAFQNDLPKVSPVAVDVPGAVPEPVGETVAETEASPAKPVQFPTESAASADVSNDAVGERENGIPSRYVATEKSTRKLELLLVEQNTAETNESISSLLDSLLEDADENP